MLSIEDLNQQIKRDFMGIKSNVTSNGIEQLIIPKGLMPLVDKEIKKQGYTTIDQESWIEDESYLVIKIIS